MIGILLVAYLVIAFGSLLLPAVHREISKQVSQARGNPIVNEMTGRAPVPESKLLAFRLVLTLASALVWPLLFAHLIQQRLRERQEQRNWEKRVSSGLEFSRMGGVGTIVCGACGFDEDVTSFTHGYADNGERNCEEGRQCLTCGKFDAIHGQGEPIRFAERACECGGTLSRDHFLFCPSCRSKELRYGMGVIS